MASFDGITVNVDLEPSENVRLLIAAEVEKQLVGKFADLLKEIEARVQPKELAKLVSDELGRNTRLAGGRRMEHK